MKIIFIGTGSAFSVADDNYSSTILLSPAENDEKLLIDCATDTKRALHRLGYSYRDITDIYITQLSADHVGGLEWIALTTKFDPHCHKPNLYINPKMASNLWSKTLAGGMMTLQGTEAKLHSFFKVHEVYTNANFYWHDIEFQTIQTTSSVENNAFLPSQGLLFTVGSTRIFLTTETQFPSEQLLYYYENVDIIFQDCATSLPSFGIHPTFSQLSELSPAIKAKMWLYHYNPGPLPDAAAAGFRGFIQPGQIFEF